MTAGSVRRQRSRRQDMRYPAEHGKASWREGEGGYSGRAAPRRFEPANAGTPPRPEPLPRARSLAFSLIFAASAALGGAALPFTFGEMFPRSFTATAVVGVEKPAAVDALASGLRAEENLERIVLDLGLQREPAFAGASPGALAVATDLLSGTERTAAPPAAALQRALAGTLSTMPDRQAGRLSLAVTTADPELSVRIANAFAHRGVEQAAAEALDEAHGLTAARKAAEDAERALADFTAAEGSGSLDEAARRAAEIATRDADIAAREAALATLKSDSARVSALKIADTAANLADLGIDAPAFDDARQKYVAARLDFDRFAADLGPRHPRLLAARSAAEDARNRLQDALRKLDIVYKDKVRAATRALDEAKAARAKLDAGPVEGDNLDALENLKREADRLRADYLDKLDISRAVPQPTPARLIDNARMETVIANGASPLLVAVAGAGLGLLAAFAWLYFTGRTRAAEEEGSPVEEPAFAPESLPESERGWYEDDEWGPPPAENDDEPLAERLRALLRRSAAMDEREAERRAGPDRQAELEEIRRRMASLRDRVEAYNARRISSRY